MIEKVNGPRKPNSSMKRSMMRLLLGGLTETAAFSRFRIYTIEGSVAAPTVNETVACFHAKGAIANLNEPTSEA